MSKLLGIDIGGTKVSISIGDVTGEIFASHRIPTTELGTAGEGLQAVGHAARELIKQNRHRLVDIAAIGIGCPGPVNVKEGVLVNPPNMEGWDNVPLVESIQNELGRPTYMNNDANGAALAEWRFGQCRGVDNLIYLTASTGMGGGIIANRRLIQGACDCAGEVGHYVLQPGGRESNSGLLGTFEGYCGGMATADYIRRLLDTDPRAAAMLERAGGNPEAINFQVFREACESGDELALELWDEFVERLAQGIGMLLMTLNPDAIILGTIAIHTGDELMAPLRAALPRYAWPAPLEACRIEPSTLEGRIGDLSALAIAMDGLEDS